MNDLDDHLSGERDTAGGDLAWAIYAIAMGAIALGLLWWGGR